MTDYAFQDDYYRGGDGYGQPYNDRNIQQDFPDTHSPHYSTGERDPYQRAHDPYEPVEPYVNLPPPKPPHQDDDVNAGSTMRSNHSLPRYTQEPANYNDDPDGGRYGDTNVDPPMGTLSRADKFGAVPLYQEDANSFGDRRDGTMPYNADFGPGDRIGDATDDDFIHPAQYSPQYESLPRRGGNTHPEYPTQMLPLTAAYPDNREGTLMSSIQEPELREVIILLKSDQVNDVVKYNAAAYLQHVSFKNPHVKERVRELGGIKPLIDLLSSPNPMVHKNAVAALRNLSFGNEKAIKVEITQLNGIKSLVYLLQQSQDADVRELVTAVLWNLSTYPEVKQYIIADALSALVNVVMLPHAGLEKRGDQYVSLNGEVYWSTLFRNASGVIRNVSSDEKDARARLRDCDGLVESLLHIVRSAIGNNDIDNKSVENCVCTLRNLSYALQEMVDHGYLLRRDPYFQENQRNRKPQNKGCCAGLCSCCIGKQHEQGPRTGQTPNSRVGQQQREPVIQAPQTRGSFRGKDLLWQPNTVEIYLPLITDCSNPDTLEAATGAIQNLAACEWQPSIDFRTEFRKEKGLPILVELLNIGDDRVVCTAATALRNLARDGRNRELIGKYAMQTLIRHLPDGNIPTTPTYNTIKKKRTDSQGRPIHIQPAVPAADLGNTSLTTVASILATIYAVIKDSPDFTNLFDEMKGIERCMHIAHSGHYLETTGPIQNRNKVPRFSAQILRTVWNQTRDVHPRYLQQGWTAAHFCVSDDKPLKRMVTRKKKQPTGVTMSQPGMSMSSASNRQDSMPREQMLRRDQQELFRASSLSGEPAPAMHYNVEHERIQEIPPVYEKRQEAPGYERSPGATLARPAYGYSPGGTLQKTPDGTILVNGNVDREWLQPVTPSGQLTFGYDNSAHDPYATGPRTGSQGGTLRTDGGGGSRGGTLNRDGKLGFDNPAYSHHGSDAGGLHQARSNEAVDYSSQLRYGYDQPSPRAMNGDGGGLRPDEIPMTRSTDYPHETMESRHAQYNDSAVILTPYNEPLYAHVDRERKMQTRMHADAQGNMGVNNADSWV